MCRDIQKLLIYTFSKAYLFKACHSFQSDIQVFAGQNRLSSRHEDDGLPVIDHNHRQTMVNTVSDIPEKTSVPLYGQLSTPCSVHLPESRH
jgi:hypothetical protein